MTRVFNFSAGPAALPEPVLRLASEEMLDWHGTGMSVMEMSHRSPAFMGIAAEAQALLRELLAVPATHRILFMQGGALAENAIVPMNLLGGSGGSSGSGGAGRADYIDTGWWSGKSIAEARRYGTVNVAASSADSGHTQVPARDRWRLDPQAAYVHICSNETIGGVQYPALPDVGAVPLVVDMSSEILSRTVDWGRVALAYAGAQKNIGPAGLTLVIVRDDLLLPERALPALPTAFNYRVVADHDSMYNTPPTYAIYIAGLVFRWIKVQGGVAEMARRNTEKAALLYAAIDGPGSSGFYRCPVQPEARSQMNVVFRTPSDELDATFVKAAAAQGLVQLKGHRVVGGLRASIYNAMPLAGVQSLVNFMRHFETTHG